MELNHDNPKIVKIEDHWFGRPFFNCFGTGRIIRRINGKLFYQWILGNQGKKIARQKQ